ncbi:MAG: Azurin [Verrucomicrobia bacterium]|nr:MAG: Azurin [Verrucomicrobiota bacterium]
MKPLSRLLPLLVLVPALVQPAAAFAKNAAATETAKVSIKVLPGLVRFETTRFDVTAGAAVELTFSNDCVMPHNLVILKPDAEPAVIAAVNTMGLEGMEKNFVPVVPGIVAATKLLAPTKKEVLEFTAPEMEGEYPYVCTFPGHWFTMRGVMRVRAAGVKLDSAQKSTEKVVQVEDALKNSGMTHKPLGTFERPLVMRTFAPDPDLDPVVFAHHGVGKDAVKYDPATRLDITKKEKDPVTGVEREVPAVIKAEKGVAGAIAVNHGPDFSYVWDSTECRLLYVWRGGFLDMDTYWGKEPGSGRPKMYIPLLMGHLVYRASGPTPQALGTDPAPVFLGYKMEGGAPEFRYRIGARTYREKVVPSPKDGFELRVTLEGAASAPAWKVAPADVDAVRVREESGGLVLSIKDRPEPPQQKAKQSSEAKIKKP